jgi:NAD-dependent deacetylase
MVELDALLSSTNAHWIESIKTVVSRAKHFVMITGAGLSEACGIPTLNADMQGKPFHQWFTRRAFQEDPEWFFSIYRNMLRRWQDIVPNEAYHCIANAGIPVITQNIDGLHIKAGSKKVIELHGNIREMVCDGCDSLFTQGPLFQTAAVPRCPTCKTGVLRPNIVFEGEHVHHFAEAMDLAGQADLMVIVGTKLRMQPCNQLPQIVHRNGGEVIVINQDAEHWIPQILNETEIRPSQRYGTGLESKE